MGNLALSHYIVSAFPCTYVHFIILLATAILIVQGREMMHQRRKSYWNMIRVGPFQGHWRMRVTH